MRVMRVPAGSGAPGQRERMSSPLGKRKVRLRGLGAAAVYRVPDACASAARHPRGGWRFEGPFAAPARPSPARLG